MFTYLACPPYRAHVCVRVRVRVVSNVNLKSFSIFFTFVSVARFADFYLQLKEFVVCIDVCRM